MDTNNTYYQTLEPFFGSWHIKRFIGEGSFGKCFEIEKSDISGVYTSAMKIITVPYKNSGNTMGFDSMSHEEMTHYYKDVAKEVSKEFILMERLKGCTNIVSYEDHEIRDHANGIGCDILIRMELLTPLNTYYTTYPPTEADVIRLGIDMCRALEVCAKENIIHRDIKPSNIFVSEHGDYKLGDFGVARHLEASCRELSKKGTYDYMAPEVYRDCVYDARADIFSLGIVLYKLMNNGRIPFLPPAPAPIGYNDSESAIKRRLCGEMPLPPVNANPAFAQVILQACQGNPDARFSSATQMREALEALALGGSVDQPRPRKKSIALAAVLAAVVLAAGITTAVLYLKNNSQPAVKPDTQPVDTQPEQTASANGETHWVEVTGEYEKTYPFYAITSREIDADGQPTGNIKTDKTKKEFDGHDMQMYLKKDLITQTIDLTYILYVDGKPNGYTEPASTMDDVEWVIDDFDRDTYKEIAHQYVDGIQQQTYKRTKVTLDPESDEVQYVLAAEKTTDGWQEEEELLWGVVRQETEYENGQLTGNVRYTLVGIPEEQPDLLKGAALSNNSNKYSYVIYYSAGYKDNIGLSPKNQNLWQITRKKMGYTVNDEQLLGEWDDLPVFFTFEIENNSDQKVKAYYFINGNLNILDIDVSEELLNNTEKALDDLAALLDVRQGQD